MNENLDLDLYTNPLCWTLRQQNFLQQIMDFSSYFFVLDDVSLWQNLGVCCQAVSQNPPRNSLAKTPNEGGMLVEYTEASSHTWGLEV